MPKGLMPTLTHGFRFFTEEYIEATKAVDVGAPPVAAALALAVLPVGGRVGELGHRARLRVLRVGVEVVVDMDAVHVVARDDVVDHPQRVLPHLRAGRGRARPCPGSCAPRTGWRRVMCEDETLCFSEALARNGFTQACSSMPRAWHSATAKASAS